MAEGFFEFREKLMRQKRDDAAPPAPSASRAAAAITVSQLTRQIDRAIKDGLPQSILVKGEASNLSLHGPSGHLYFTLKDPDSCIDCVMWRSDAERLKFKPTDGMELLAGGRVVVYAPRGKYQLSVSSLQPLGQGALEVAFQQLRAKLEREGLFAADRKKPLPLYPQTIALVTARQGAALADMLKVLRRFAWLRLMVYAVPVQGDGAAERIAAALRHLSRESDDVGGIDVIILGRGGGSLEDLWAFNDEVVARAIGASNIPIVTGIGHEVDVCIADLIADHHAHTPTEAAAVVTANWRDVGDVLDGGVMRLRRGVRTLLQHAQARLDGVARHELFRRPTDRVNSLRQVIDDRERELRARMNRRIWDLQRTLAQMQQVLAEHSPMAQMRLHRQRLMNLGERLGYAATMDRVRRRARLDALERQLRALGAESVLRRGFSITTLKKNGAVVRSMQQVKGGDELLTKLSDGTIESTAEDPKQPKLF